VARGGATRPTDEIKRQAIDGLNLRMDAVIEPRQLKNATVNVLGACAVRIRLIDPSLGPEWDQLVKSLGGDSIFHTSAWARVLVNTYHYSPCYFAAFLGGTPVAALPLMEVDSWLAGCRGVGLPFSDFCNPLFTSGEAFNQTLHVALRYGRTRGWRYLELRRPAQPVPNVPASARYYGHILHLEPEKNETAGDGATRPAYRGTGEAAKETPRHRPTRPTFGQLFDSFDSSVRRAIRKAERVGVTTEISTELQEVREFYRLHCLTRRRHGLPPQPFRFFECLHEHLLKPGHGFVVMARSGGLRIAAAIFGHSQGRAVYKFGASDPKFQELRANSLVMNHAIHWCADNGMASLDFGRTGTTNDGLRRFKLGWGAQETQIYYFRYDLRQNRNVEQGSETREPGSRLCRHLPLSLLRLAGKILYRHMG